ncbi:hypothetical protein COV20_00315 [Candidatus Woesearchaeota archaeon CG10_big_fil_rev_8_21_14_0_10_45_16]|nr:MAG: hypothetical protein COV20_00315 [Candidatus Woesearchaeota archaeon CG10_big_fil_rev_8_21_14_0_10_45_16]
MNRWFILFFILLVASSFSFAVPAGDYCNPTSDQCPTGDYCSGPEGSFVTTKCCPIGTEYDLSTDVCEGDTSVIEEQGDSHHFMTYPLESTTDNFILSGWYRGGGVIHKGIDYVPDEDKTYYIVAAADGVVSAQHFYTDFDNLLTDMTLGECISSMPSAAYGNRIMIDHDNGLTSIYGHFNKGSILVEPGQHVTRGQRLGTMGNSGCSTNKHLHFELREGSTKLDPYDLYDEPSKYPDRKSPDATCGDDHYWTQCPPVVSGNVQLDSLSPAAGDNNIDPPQSNPLLGAVISNLPQNDDPLEEEEEEVNTPQNNPPAADDSAMCGTCGDGLFNICDEAECNSLGACTFEDNFFINGCHAS